MIAMSQILRLVSTHTNKECEMCTDVKLGKRWEYRNYQYVPTHLPKILLVCEKCIYREKYGSKDSKKAIKQKLLEKLNDDFGNYVPELGE